MASKNNSPINEELIRKLPKVDLHAHLSGSISQQKLAEMLKRDCGKTFEMLDCQQSIGTPEEANRRCFDYFDAVAQIVTNLSALRECTRSVLEAFADENCIYLELRTGPKSFKVGNTPEEYVDVVRECIAELNTPHHRMHVKLLLSVKRTLGEASTRELVLAQIDKVIELSRKNDDLVVGVDVCGNPKDETLLCNVLPALMDRKTFFQDFPLTFHVGEVDNDEECDAVIDHIVPLNIRRLGHVIHLKDHHIDRLNELSGQGYSVGIEICPTSNQTTTQLSDIRDHHFGRWWRKCRQHLQMSINTDDCGLFSCSVSGEIMKVIQGFGLSLGDVLTLQKKAIESSFYPDKEELINLVDTFDSNLATIENSSQV